MSEHSKIEVPDDGAGRSLLERAAKRFDLDAYSAPPVPSGLAQVRPQPVARAVQPEPVAAPAQPAAASAPRMAPEPMAPEPMVVKEGRFGLYHAAGTGYVSWCGLAREVFRVSASLGGPSVPVTAIPSTAYPTPARRPLNSRLDCGKLVRDYGISLPPWQEGVADGVSRLLAAA